MIKNKALASQNKVVDMSLEQKLLSCPCVELQQETS
jgi:hypothetical protein